MWRLGGGDVTAKDHKTTERLILEEEFGGDLEAYAEYRAGPVTPAIKADPAHPWHHRKQCAKLLIDMPDDHRAPPHLPPLFTRAEVVEKLAISDSGFGNLGVPVYRKSGRWSMYNMEDVLAYRAVSSYIAVFRQKTGGDRPTGSRDQIAAMLKADFQTANGHPGPYYFPPRTKS